eukprot:COSAG01_NODE_58162_length_307_cov_3.620192_1_plen_60_part_10
MAEPSTGDFTANYLGVSVRAIAYTVVTAPCWRDIRQLPAPGPTVRSACPRAVRPKREPHG